MRTAMSGRIGGLLALGAMIQLAGMTAADASVFRSDASLPVLGVPYASTVGAGCFMTAGVCISAGNLVMTTPVSSSFDGSGQAISTGAVYSGELTTLLGAPIGPITLTGTLAEEVLGRTTDLDTGSWATELLSMSLSGPVLGHILTLALDPDHSSTGVTSVEPAVNGNTPGYRIDSFFDIFVELSLDGPTPLNTTRGPIHASIPTPEPAGLALLAPALLGLLAARRRR